MLVSRGNAMEMVMDVDGGCELDVRAEEAGAEASMSAMLDRMETAVKELEAMMARLEEKATTVEAASVPVTVAYANGRKTVAGLSAKSDEGHGGIGAIDAALVSLPVEQRIAVKAQLLRAGLAG